MCKRKLLSAFLAAAMAVSAFTGLAACAEAAAIDFSGRTLTGSAAWNNSSNNYEKVFDGDTSTFFDGLLGGWCQVDLGANYSVTKLAFYPRKRTDRQPSEYVKRLNGGVFYGSQNGTEWTALYTISGLSTELNDESAVKWYEADVSGVYRYIKYQNDTAETNIAEIAIYGEYDSDSSEEPPAPEATDEPLSSDFVLIDRSGWSVTANSSQSASGNNSPAMVLDGNAGTIWHSRYSGVIENDPETDPIYLQIDMGKTNSISGIRYTPREKTSASGSINGVITAYEVYVSADGESWTKTGEGNLGYTTSDAVHEAKNIVFAPIDARYIRLAALGNLTNGNQYIASCAELDAYTYTGDMEEHPITMEREKVKALISDLENINTEHEIKAAMINKAQALLSSGSVDGIEEFITATGSVIDALGWMEQGIDDVYIGRIMDMLVDRNMSAAAASAANDALSGFYKTGNDVKDSYSAIWQDEFTMSESEYDMPLYERIGSAITRARARIDSGDGNDYIMIKELVSYISGKYGYSGYENQFGRNAAEAEAVVSNINFALTNLDNNVKTELTTYKSGEIWLDTLGSKISAHGGQIIKQGDTYYWYGEDNKISYYLTTGVSCYSSKDLKNWKYEGLAFKVFDDGTDEGQFTDEFMTDDLLGTKGRIERPKVIYNEKTGKYVMWMHLEKNGDYTLSIAGVAISDSPTGPFKWLWYGRPVHDPYVMVNTGYTQTFRDMNLFVDDDGKAYVFYSSENNQVMYAVQLNDEYTWINDSGLTKNEETLKAAIDGNTARFTVPESEERALTGYFAAYDENNRLAGVTLAQLTAGDTVLELTADNAALYKAFIWTDDQQPVISAEPNGTLSAAEIEFNEGNVVIPDMRDITSAKYTYGKTSFTRYQLKSGGAIALDWNSDEGVYKSARSDGRIYSPEYADGRWARVGQIAGAGNDDETLTSTTVNNTTTLRREAPAPIKVNGKYYLVTSALSGWRANPSLTQVADSVLGTWTPTGNPMTGSGPANNGQWSQNADTGTSYNSQSTCVIELPNGEYMYMGDRWKNGVYETSNSLGIFPDVDVKASTYVWLPITFETDSTYGENTLKVRWNGSWSYDGATEPIATPSAAPTIAPIEDTNNYEAYLFVHFKDGTSTADSEQIYFATSTDGHTWKKVNNGNPVLRSTLGTEGVRDPHIVRSPDGKGFFLIATDLSMYKLGGSWSNPATTTTGSKSIMVWESKDLVNWSDQRMVRVAPDSAGNTWAPESIYNKDTGRFMVFWASKTDGKQTIYCSETTDFVSFTEPQIYIEKDKDIIDTTIVEENGVYYRFSKDETTGQIILETSDSLYGTFTQNESFNVDVRSEGPTCFKLKDGGWELLVDKLAGSGQKAGYTPYVTDSLASGVFGADSEYSEPYIFRHGTVIPITMEEYNAINEAYPSNVEGSLEVPVSAAAQVRATDDTWQTINSGSTKLVEGDNAIEVNGATFMGAYYAFNAAELPVGAKVKSAVLTVNRASNFKQIYYTVRKADVPETMNASNIFSAVSSAVAKGDLSLVGTTSDGAAASGDDYGTVTVDVTSAYSKNGANAFLLYLPGAGNSKRNLKADAVMTVNYEISTEPEEEEVIYNDDAEPSEINIPASLQSDPVIYYDFEDIENGVIADRSGNGNDAALHSGGEVSDNPLSGYGAALKLDTAGYIHLPDNITQNLEDFTISMKINVLERGSGIHNKKLFNLGDKIYYVPQGNTAYGYHMYTHFGNINVVSQASQLAMDAANTTRWDDLTIVKEGKTIRMYVNGALDKEGTITDTTASLGTLNNNTVGVNMTLNIDEFKLFNRALSYKEVTGEEEPDLNYTLSISGEKGVDIQDGMYGLFFEDINYAADGGLYAEMVENRSFEAIKNTGAANTSFDGLYAWAANDGRLEISDSSGLNNNNTHYAVFTADSAGQSFKNQAYDGLYLTKDEDYDLSFYAKTDAENSVTVSAVKDGTVYAAETISISGDKWNKYTATLISNGTVDGADLVISLDNAGTASFDMISLIPCDAVEGIFRRDLAEKLRALNPGFLRFPGGCVIEGYNLSNAYNWKDSVGDAAQRKQNWNRWATHTNSGLDGGYKHYNQTLGLGFYEYFVLCEYLDAKAVPVLNCGMGCQYQGKDYAATVSDEFGQYLEDALDLIEFANGDTDTEWGALRAEMGHPAPFNLELIGIGNEQWEEGANDFHAKYEAFEKAIHEAYPKIKLVSTAGPDVNTATYNSAWSWIREKTADAPDFAYVVDEHYYMSPDWFFANDSFYDNYDRSVKVFAGEYASRYDSDSKPNNPEANKLISALAEAAFMTGLERNADVVYMASYAPLMARVKYTQWSPDMIWFDGRSSYGTPSYYTQYMYSNNAGDYTIRSSVDGNSDNAKLYETVSFDEATGDVIIKLINSKSREGSVTIDLSKYDITGNADITVLSGENADAYNTINDPENIAPVNSVIDITANYTYTMPAYSFTVMRVHTK